MTGRSRFEYGLPPEEMWGKAQKDAKHACVQEAGTGRWVVVARGSGQEVKDWGGGRKAKLWR